MRGHAPVRCRSFGLPDTLTYLRLFFSLGCHLLEREEAEWARIRGFNSWVSLPISVCTIEKNAVLFQKALFHTKPEEGSHLCFAYKRYVLVTFMRQSIFLGYLTVYAPNLIWNSEKQFSRIIFALGYNCFWHLNLVQWIFRWGERSPVPQQESDLVSGLRGESH